MINPKITQLYIKGTPEAIDKIWQMIKKSDLKIGEDMQIIDFCPEIMEEQEDGVYG